MVSGTEFHNSKDLNYRRKMASRETHHQAIISAYIGITDQLRIQGHINNEYEQAVITDEQEVEKLEVLQVILQKVQTSIEERNANMTTSSLTYLLETNAPTKIIPYACTDITDSTTHRPNNTSSFKPSDKFKNMTNTHRATNTSSFRLSEKLQNLTSGDIPFLFCCVSIFSYGYFGSKQSKC